MKFKVDSDGEYKLTAVELSTSKHGFGVVTLKLHDITLSVEGSMNMAIMDWQRIKREVDAALMQRAHLVPDVFNDDGVMLDIKTTKIKPKE